MSLLPPHPFSFFFFNDTATTEIYTLSLHDALPISTATAPRAPGARSAAPADPQQHPHRAQGRHGESVAADRSEEHTSELQSHSDLVCRLLLEKKKRINEDNAYKDHTHNRSIAHKTT